MAVELRYCPKCGKAELYWDRKNKWFCKNCGFTLYHNCAAAVAVIIKCGNELLFTKRNQEPKKGELDLAGGFVDPKETAEETCKRELLEEMGINIDLKALKILGTQSNIYHYKGIDYNTLDIFYLYEVEEKFQIKPELKEISEGLWLKPSDISIDQLAFTSQKQFLSLYLQNL